MAHRGNLSRNPHLQVGSRLTALFLAFALALSSPTAFAASKKPTPKAKVTAKASTKARVTAKPSAKTTAKPSAKVSTQATTKASAKATSKATSSPTTKATKKPTQKATKKPAVKKKKKKVRVTPSPKPVWPPKGFSVEGEVYAKVPTAKELVGLISANSTLAKQIKSCTTYICGSVQVASETGCIWWEVLATVTDGDGKKLGELTTAFGKSGAREFKTLIVVSPENVDKGGSAKINSVICHHEDRVSGEPSVSYKKTE